MAVDEVHYWYFMCDRCGRDDESESDTCEGWSVAEHALKSYWLCEGCSDELELFFRALKGDDDGRTT